MSKIRVADYIVERLAALGVENSFVVAGGASMHLNDAIAKSPALTKVYCHHEQAAARRPNPTDASPTNRPLSMSRRDQEALMPSMVFLAPTPTPFQ
jgi:hypothetical protein